MPSKEGVLNIMHSLAPPWAGTYFQNSALPGRYLKRKGVGWRARL